MPKIIRKGQHKGTLGLIHKLKFLDIMFNLSKPIKSQASLIGSIPGILGDIGAIKLTGNKPTEKKSRKIHYDDGKCVKKKRREGANTEETENKEGQKHKWRPG